MIRGAIEVASPTIVSGWIYCSEFDLQGQSVFGYVGKRCIGSGKIYIYRKDLHDAGLGDGMCGFHFQVKLEDGEALDSIVVRLHKSDLFLAQPSSVITGGTARHDAKVE